MPPSEAAVLAAPGQQAPSGRRQPVRGRRNRREQRAGLLFAAPWLIGFAVLTAGPMLLSLYYSFTEFSIFTAPEWVGLANYQELAGDDRFFRSVVNTAYLTFVGVPLGLALALATALVLNQRMPGQGPLRALAYFPAIIPAVVVAYLWRWLLNGQDGLVNEVIRFFGLTAPNWLLDPAWTRPAVILIGLWTVGGTTVIYLAALRNVPAELHEAAMLDGAGALQRFRHVTLPTIAPVTVFQLIAGLILGLQNFTLPYILGSGDFNMSTGGPGETWLTYVAYLYVSAFSSLRMGYASAMGWILLIVSMLLTALVLRLSRNWADGV